MAITDWLGFGGSKSRAPKGHKSPAQENEDKAKRLAEMQKQYDTQNAAAAERKAQADAASKAEALAAKKKKAGQFWSDVLGKKK